MLAQGLPSFFHLFSFSSRCLYSAYVFLIISSLAFSTLSCVQLCPNLPLSVIIFLKIKVQTLTAMVHCLGEPLRRFCCCWSSFHFYIFFSFLILILLLFFICDVLHSHLLSASSLYRPWTIVRFLHQFYTFSPAHRRVIRDTFILIFLRFSCFFTASATEFWEAFFTSGIFYLPLLTNILTQFCGGDESTPIQILFYAGQFCGGDESRNTQIQILLYACPHRVTAQEPLA